MTYILGIDTGGTNTDCALLEGKTKRLISGSKAFTTKPYLETGIANALDALNFNSYNDIAFVALSTTLATNAIVENQGCKTGIILIGAEPENPLPTDNVKLLSGKLDIKGREKVLMSEVEIENAINEMKNEVEAIAISGYASVRNPIQELRIMDYVKRNSGLPVFCAHMLSGSLGFWERTITAALNASLIKIIDRFINATKSVLINKGITAPLMIVKSDGTLMNEVVALERPVDTILSGPAASILGARHLTGIDDALILDIGGTTSDIANLSCGKVKINKEGATVGGWLTHCRSAEVSTHGIGGDSRIYLNRDGEFTVGPHKVLPLCIAGSVNPELINEIQAPKGGNFSFSNFQKFDCIRLVSICTKNFIEESYDSVKQKLSDILQSEIHSLQYVFNKCDISEEQIAEFINTGFIQHISLTPTDLLHVIGKYTSYDEELPKLAVALIAHERKSNVKATVTALEDAVIKKLTFSCIQSSADFEYKKLNFEDDPISMYLLEKAFSDKRSQFLNTFFRLEKPLVGVGGPAASWLPAVAEKLNCELIVPRHSDVANAIGAATACFCESAKGLIRPTGNNSYLVFLPEERCEFDDYEKGLAYAKSSLERFIAGKMALYNITTPDSNINVTVNEVFTEAFSSGKKNYIETRLTATSSVDPVIE